MTALLDRDCALLDGMCLCPHPVTLTCRRHAVRLRKHGTSGLPEDLPRHREVHPCGLPGGLYDSSLWTGRGPWGGWVVHPPLSWLLWRRWWWGLRGWASARKFRCLVCGKQCDQAPADSGFWRSTAVCPEHCPEHDYEYDRDRGGRCCVTCGQPAEED